MRKNSFDSVLMNNERIILHSRVDMRFVWPYGTLGVVMGLAWAIGFLSIGFGYHPTNPNYPLNDLIFERSVIAAPLVVILAVFFRAYLEYKYLEFAITDSRVLAKSGIFGQYISEIELKNVKSVTTTQDIWGRMLGYGSVVFTGYGDTLIHVPNIPDPGALRKTLLETQEKQRH